MDFKSRYDGKKVRLLDALDPVTGIGYGNLNELAVAPDLLRKVQFPEKMNKTVNLGWSDIHRLLFSKWTQSRDPTDPIIVSQEDISALKSLDLELPLPPSISVMFRIWEEFVVIESVGGSSAHHLTGRFTPWNSDIHDMSRDVAEIEQQANSDVLFAEVAQLSDNHADNINRRLHIYDYEININCVSTLPTNNQIPLSDLWVSVDKNKLVLESGRLKKIIIPRLSSAYNYHRNRLAVFRLLCDLQYQGIHSHLTFRLHDYFPGMEFYPRVIFDKTILSLAEWHLSEEELKGLKVKVQEIALANFEQIRIDRTLPQILAINRSDQQLVFNLDKKNEVLFLIDAIKGMEKVTLHEFLLPTDSLVCDDTGQPLISQFITQIYQRQKVYSGHPVIHKSYKRKVKANFLPGSRWLYFKLYCSPAMANELLADKILPIFKVYAKNEILSWFFIRYFDTGHHIRLRLRVKEEAVGKILSRFKNRLSKALDFHIINEYQAETYRRELDRYGRDMIDIVESFFQVSSELIIRYIGLSRKKRFPFLYDSLCFISVAELIKSFCPSPEDRIIFMEVMVETFYAEFSNDKTLKKDLDLKYRELKREISLLLSRTDYYKKIGLGDLKNLLSSETDKIISAMPGRYPHSPNKLLADLIHMHLNRIFEDQPRKQELIIYYCLYKHQLSENARNKTK